MKAMLSLATAVVGGGAFGNVVGSAVDDIIMPVWFINRRCRFYDQVYN
jgi:large-conductance mechanosensitive channel